MKALQIIECAYRGTLEEQDDTIIWLTHSMRDAGANLSLMLCGAAVNYVLHGQDATGLQFGKWDQTRPPDIEGELARLRDKQVEIYVVREDMERRGIAHQSRLEGVHLIERAGIPALMEAHDRVWFW